MAYNKNTNIVEKIKSAVQVIDAKAQIILYGSRARGTQRKDSDWDLLILVNKPTVSIKDEQDFRHKLFDVELETGQAISTFVYSFHDWNSRMKVTPLYTNVTREGIIL
jgi:predicted nucleotidyltransferase